MPVNQQRPVLAKAKKDQRKATTYRTHDCGLPVELQKNTSQYDMPIMIVLLVDRAPDPAVTRVQPLWLSSARRGG